jgi:flavin reductase (DIM6/NTAB) family NADH-FMN oxidoreductase RutF
VAPLVVIGTQEPDGSYDLAPKHLAMPLGWGNYFGFMCTPRHHTYQNIRRTQAFTVSFPRPNQVLATSLTAAPRCADDHKMALSVLPTIPATMLDGVFLQEAYLYLECDLDRIVDGFGENSLIAGKILAAHVDEAALRMAARDDQDVLRQSPLLAYLSPGRFACIDHSQSFPFHEGFQR